MSRGRYVHTRPWLGAWLLALGCAESGHGDSVGAQPEGAQLEPDCTRSGAFEVELGEGEDVFVPLAADAQPLLYHGAQGGTHLVLAARVTTPDPIDRYEVTLVAEAGQDCSAGTCASFTTIGEIDLVIAGSRVLVGTGEVEIPSLFLVVDGWEGAPLRRLTLEVADACDRRASTARTFEP